MQVIHASQVESYLQWPQLAQALAHGHTLARARISDSFLTRGKDTLLLRSAWIDGLGMAVKVASIFPGNPAKELPSVQGNVMLYNDQTGAPEAMVDFDLVTRCKTVGDSYLAASRLARPDTRRVLIVGAGRIAGTALKAYRQLFPEARFSIWNHRIEGAKSLAAAFPDVTVVSDLAQACHEADLISCATLAQEPLIRGQWLRPGQHVDLIGAFRADMREADDVVLERGEIFVDSRETTISHIGELKIPLAAGVITAADIRADLYDLDAGLFARPSDDAITVFKNGGGAHLDLMTARYILDCYLAASVKA